MPIHDYSCNKCNHVQEVLTTSVSQEPTLICENCSGSDMTKLVANKMTFELKGEGWAADGYQYEYTNSMAGIDKKVYPVYDRKKAKEKLEIIKKNTFGEFKHERIPVK